jgi:hypothetical protein
LFTGLKVTHPGARQYAHPKTSVGGPREEGMSYQQRNKNDYWISIAKNFFIKAVVLQRLAIDAGQFLTLSADICGAPPAYGLSGIGQEQLTIVSPVAQLGRAVRPIVAGLSSR